MADSRTLFLVILDYCNSAMFPIVHFFVYGTLKLGQCREKCWPTPPLAVLPAWTFGQLYDLGAYPALLLSHDSDADKIAGQVWSFQRSEFDMIIKTLDRIEGTNQPHQANEYDRVELPVTIRETDAQIIAQTYIYSRPLDLRRNSRRLPASVDWKEEQYAVWPTRCDWE